MRPCLFAPLFAILIFAAPLRADFTTPPFTESPPVGASKSAELLIVINPNSTVSVYRDPSVKPYDHFDDVLVGVLNNSTQKVTSLSLHSSVDSFGFDRDGVDTHGVTGNSRDKSGYGGPMTWFSDIRSHAHSGTVNFIGGLQPGKTTYFGLEDGRGKIVGTNTTPSSSPTTASVTPEPNSLLLLSLGGAACWWRWRRKRP
jgi:hypothetical protein